MSIEPDETIYYLLKLGKRFNLFSAAPARYATVSLPPFVSESQFVFFFPSTYPSLDIAQGKAHVLLNLFEE